MGSKAAIMYAPGAPISVDDLRFPDLDPGSLLLRVIASEVCGTDVHLHHGRLSGVPYPIVPGHVSVGRVAEMGGTVRDINGKELQVDDVVTFYDVHGTCHECWHCTIAGQPNRCASRKVYGITFSSEDGLHGGWSEYLHLLPGTVVLRLPENVSAEQMIGGGCGLFTGFAAVDRSSLRMGDVVVVQGSGPVGICAAAFAVLRGAARVIIIGDPAARLEVARGLLSDDTLSVSGTTQDERLEVIRDATGGRGADLVIEASGNPSAVEEGPRLCRDGGEYVIAGHYTDVGDASVNPHTDINRKHLTIKGQWGTDLRHVNGALNLLSRHSERLPLQTIAGRRYSLEEANEALADVEAQRVTKAIIVP